MVACVGLVLLLLAAARGATPASAPKECVADANCTAIAHSKCISDPEDSKMRCLCGDKKPPQDGKCELLGKALGHDCEDESDCPANAECTLPNGVSNVTEPKIKKVCQCKDDFREFGKIKRCVPLGRLCNDDKECSQDANTTCTEDRVDHKKRCLCGSGNAPGVLPSCPKASLLLPCQSDEECPINAQCSPPADGKGRICNCISNFKSKDNIVCESNSAGRAAVISLTMVISYMSLAIIL